MVLLGKQLSVKPKYCFCNLLGNMHFSTSVIGYIYWEIVIKGRMYVHKLELGSICDLFCENVIDNPQITLPCKNCAAKLIPHGDGSS